MTSGYLTVIATITARPGLQEETLAELRKLVEPTRQEEGCLQYDLHSSDADPCLFLFVERWTSREALAKHAQSPHVSAFRAVRERYLTRDPEVTLWDPLD